MGALLLLLLDSRSPAGAHNHSAGMEAAIATGLVRDLDGVEAFCRTRLWTAGRVAADFARAACALAPEAVDAWAELEAELDARTPSEAQRAASRQLGRGLARMVRTMLPGFDPPAAQHPLVLGGAVAAAGGTPDLAARAAALGTVTTPASAAVRLLGLDPFAVQGLLADFALAVDRGDFAAETTAKSPGSALAADTDPALDLLADYHLTTEVRLFAS